MAKVLSMESELELTIRYQEGEQGYVVAQIEEFPAAISQGRTREEARESVLDALRELVLSYIESPPERSDQPFDHREAIRIHASTA
jgi:predicted RNase H-like HicB family nuclease